MVLYRWLQPGSNDKVWESQLMCHCHCRCEIEAIVVDMCLGQGERKETFVPCHPLVLSSATLHLYHISMVRCLPDPLNAGTEDRWDPSSPGLHSEQSQRMLSKEVESHECPQGWLLEVARDGLKAEIILRQCAWWDDLQNMKAWCLWYLLKSLSPGEVAIMGIPCIPP